MNFFFLVFTLAFVFDGPRKRELRRVPRLSFSLFFLPSTRASRSPSLISLSEKKRDAMTVDEPRRAGSSWHMRPSSSANSAAAAANGEQRSTTIPLVVSFPAGFYPPVSGWEAYEGGAGGQQLLVVARAVRRTRKGEAKKEREKG